MITSKYILIKADGNPYKFLKKVDKNLYYQSLLRYINTGWQKDNRDYIYTQGKLNNLLDIDNHLLRHIYSLEPMQYIETFYERYFLALL